MSLNLEPKQSEFECIELVQPGSWHRRGPACDGCEVPGLSGVIFGVIPPDSKAFVFSDDLKKKQEAQLEELRDLESRGFEPCLTCGNAIDVSKNYGPRNYGPKVRVLFPPDDDTLAENPYLNPKGREINWDDGDPIWTAPHTDMGNAIRLVHLFGQHIRYVNEWGFLVYDGRRWQRDSVGTMQRFAKRVIWEMLRAVDTIKGGDRKEIAKLQTHAFTSQSSGKIEAMVKLASSEPTIASRVADFDQHSWLLNVRNGIVDLTTGQLLPHDPTLHFTQLVNIDYDAKAVCPRWDRFVLEVCRGDQALVDYLHRAVGYTMTGETKEQKLFFLFGDGANGKSTFLETLRRILGDYGAQLPFETFLVSRNTKPEGGLARLPGKRFVTASEAGEGRSWNEELLKSVTGGDTIVGEYKYKDAFEFRPVCKVWVAANDRPIVHGANHGIWRRFHPIPFQADFKGNADPLLDQTLKDETPGILAWAVRGAMQWNRLGLCPPPVITEALEEYKSDNDVLGRFIQERCQLDTTWSTPSSTMLQEYNEWAKRNHERGVTQTMLGSRLRKFRGGLLKKTRGTDGRTEWSGVRISVHYGDEGRASGLDRF